MCLDRSCSPTSAGIFTGVKPAWLLLGAHFLGLVLFNIKLLNQRGSLSPLDHPWVDIATVKCISLQNSFI